MKNSKLLAAFFALSFFLNVPQAVAALDLANIKFELAKLENSSDKKVILAKCDELMLAINKEDKGNASSAEFYTWKGIVTAKMAKYNKSLTLANEAKELLEKAVKLDEKNSDGAALNALGILYYRVPRFISFKDDKKAEEYFKKAIATSSNLDTNWRYGEFLIESGKKEQGLELLKLALTKADARKPDEKIKQQIVKELITKNE